MSRLRLLAIAILSVALACGAPSTAIRTERSGGLGRLPSPQEESPGLAYAVRWQAAQEQRFREAVWFGEADRQAAEQAERERQAAAAAAVKPAAAAARPAPAAPIRASHGGHSDAWWHGVAVCEQGGRNDEYFGYFSFMDGSAAGKSWAEQVAMGNALLAKVGHEVGPWAAVCVAAGYRASPGG